MKTNSFWRVLLACTHFLLYQPKIVSLYLNPKDVVGRFWEINFRPRKKLPWFRMRYIYYTHPVRCFRFLYLALKTNEKNLRRRLLPELKKMAPNKTLFEINICSSFWTDRNQFAPSLLTVNGSIITFSFRSLKQSSSFT